MTDDPGTLGDAHGQWYYCFKHRRVETIADCQLMDRMGPYPTKEAAEHWRDTVDARNEAWRRQDDEDDDA